MESKSNDEKLHGSQITIGIPVQDGRLFGSGAIEEMLLFLTRNHGESFSVTDIARAVDYSRPSVTKALDVLSSNGLVVERRDSGRRMIQMNSERIHLPDDPYFRIPQAEFRAPVRTAVESLVRELDDVLGVVLYGSVARGEADRRSDIDLWVLVRSDRLENQRQANRIRQQVEEEAFEGGRYEYDIDVEALQAVPNYRQEIREILHDGIALHETEQFGTVRQMVFHGETDA